MNPDAKKIVLRMIPYGIYVLTADDGHGKIAAATVNWVTQSSFAPPLLVTAVKADSGAYQLIKSTRKFVLNMLGKDQTGVAFTFFKPVDAAAGKLSGHPYHAAANGAPILSDAPGALECEVVAIVEQGDHHVVVAEITEAHLTKPPAGRPDEAILEMKNLGEKVFYGG
jgi:flavin reductase (DIM6/NTAB) family NADH-FMN oxidoreductase RutF